MKKSTFCLSLFFAVLMMCISCNKIAESNSLTSKENFANGISIKIIPQSSSDKILLSQLYTAKSFKSLQLGKWFKNNNNFALTEYSVSYKNNESGIKIPIISLIIRNNGGLVIGTFEAISFKDPKNKLDFNILLRNFENFNLSSGDGYIYLSDINEGYTFVKAEVVKRKVVRVTNYENPGLMTISQSLKTMPADLNHDGNITFSECYQYMNSVIQSDPESYTLCYLVGDAIGWVVSGWGPLCQYSVAASCVLISATY